MLKNQHRNEIEYAIQQYSQDRRQEAHSTDENQAKEHPLWNTEIPLYTYTQQEKTLVFTHLCPSRYLFSSCANATGYCQRKVSAFSRVAPLYGYIFCTPVHNALGVSVFRSTCEFSTVQLPRSFPFKGNEKYTRCVPYKYLVAFDDPFKFKL